MRESGRGGSCGEKEAGKLPSTQSKVPNLEVTPAEMES